MNTRKVNLGVETVQGYVCDVIQFIYKENAFGTSKSIGLARQAESPLENGRDGRDRQSHGNNEYSNIKEEALCDCLFEAAGGL